MHEIKRKNNWLFRVRHSKSLASRTDEKGCRHEVGNKRTDNGD